MSAETTRTAARLGGQFQSPPQDLERRAVMEVAAEYRIRLQDEEMQHAREIAELRENQEQKDREISELREFLAQVQER